MISHLLELRARAQVQNDWSLVCEIDAQLAREGYVFETVVPAAQERAVPVKRGPGRPRKVVS